MTPPTVGLTAALANYAAAPSFGVSEAAACAIAQTGFIDTIATMLAGQNEPVVQLILQHLGTPGQVKEAPVPFAKRSLSAGNAACINGVAGHALDYDDVALSAHTSTVLVPAILAEGHRLGISGQEALRAYVVGYEVWAEPFGREADQYHIKGWHPTGGVGTVGAAVLDGILGDSERLGPGGRGGGTGTHKSSMVFCPVPDLPRALTASIAAAKARAMPARSGAAPSSLPSVMNSVP